MANSEYLITKAEYGPGRQLRSVVRNKITEQGVLEGEIIDKMTLVSDIKRGAVYTTAYDNTTSWIKSSSVRTYKLNAQPYVRIDGNNVEFDNLGDLSW